MISKCSRLKQRVVWGEGEQFLDFDILDTIFISNEARIRVDFFLFSLLWSVMGTTTVVRCEQCSEPIIRKNQ